MSEESTTTQAEGVPPTFLRSHVAKILGITTLTVRNREYNGKYPTPTRNISNYRIYTLIDVMRLQILTNGTVDFAPIVAVMHDMGYHNPQEAMAILETAYKLVNDEVTTPMHATFNNLS